MPDNPKWVMAGVISALIFGAVAGCFRYWFGYFILGQGCIAGLGIPWLMAVMASKNTIKKAGSKRSKTFVFSLFLLFCFMTAQAMGFGLSQPWFDPLGWVGRVIDGDTSEHIFGIATHSGIENRAFSMGANRWFWIFANLFDVFFMEFFLIIGINIQSEKSEKKNG